jgi:hypothetical protein
VARAAGAVVARLALNSGLDTNSSMNLVCLIWKPSRTHKARSGNTPPQRFGSRGTESFSLRRRESTRRWHGWERTADLFRLLLVYCALRGSSNEYSGRYLVRLPILQTYTRPRTSAPSRSAPQVAPPVVVGRGRQGSAATYTADDLVKRGRSSILGLWHRSNVEPNASCAAQCHPATMSGARLPVATHLTRRPNSHPPWMAQRVQ